MWLVDFTLNKTGTPYHIIGFTLRRSLPPPQRRNMQNQNKAKWTNSCVWWRFELIEDKCSNLFQRGGVIRLWHGNFSDFINDITHVTASVRVRCDALNLPLAQKPFSSWICIENELVINTSAYFLTPLAPFPYSYPCLQSFPSPHILSFI